MTPAAVSLCYQGIPDL